MSAFSASSSSSAVDGIFNSLIDLASHRCQSRRGAQLLKRVDVVAAAVDVRCHGAA